MSFLWIRSARVIDPAARRNAVGDLFVADGRIVPSLSAAAKNNSTPFLSFISCTFHGPVIFLAVAT